MGETERKKERKREGGSECRVVCQLFLSDSVSSVFLDLAFSFSSKRASSGNVQILIGENFSISQS